MSVIDAFVSELWAKLEDAVEAADEETFQPEFWGDAEGECAAGA